MGVRVRGFEGRSEVGERGKAWFLLVEWSTVASVEREWCGTVQAEVL